MDANKLAEQIHEVFISDAPYAENLATVADMLNKWRTGGSAEAGVEGAQAPERKEVMAKAKTNNKLATAEKRLNAIAAKLELAETYFEDGALIRGLELLREAKALAEE